MTAEQYEAEAGDARAAVISKIDSRHEFFTDAVPARTILYQVSYLLDERQFAALRDAAGAVGDVEGFYLHTVERPYPDSGERLDWWIRFDDYSSYEQADVLANVIHSPSGRWAIFVDESWCAVVAGGPEFLESLLAAWPACEINGEIFGPTRQAEAYLDVLARVGSVDVVMKWLPGLLAHVYGSNECERLLSVYRAAADQ